MDRGRSTFTLTILWLIWYVASTFSIGLLAMQVYLRSYIPKSVLYK